MKTTPFWWEEAAPEHAERVIDRDHCGVLIVGAGYTGLSAAITLAEAGVDVIVIEAQRIGEGASSRNGGQIGNTPKFDLATAKRRFGDKRGAEVIEDYRQSMPFMIGRVKSLGADVDLNLNGSVTGAHCRADLANMRAARAALPPEAQAKLEILEEHEVPRAIKTETYRGAVIKHGQGSLHPAKYVRALANHARALGVRIFTGCHYGGAQRGPAGFEVAVTAEQGPIMLRADQVLIAVNGYAGPEVPWLRKRAVPVQSYIIATQSLPLEMMEELLPMNRAASDTKRVLCYYRRSPDGTRMLFGGRARFRTTSEARSAIGLRGYMEQIFPGLKGVEITHSWLGNVCFASDFTSHVGRMPDGLHYASCFNGSGVSMATYMGHRVAGLMLGQEDADRGVVNAPFPKVPLYNGKPWFLPVVGGLYRLQDKLARWRDGA
ncbi:NAD(P)/FAD-dependent oxidoreductase [Pseudorhodobacter aquimaris]|uniref:NAD(P)/FAD-dependent oxidoreductase n=1 Tax=Pseudorhodobacter aquimaris TaxID=687412 RepID=UPI00067DD99A|nr:FAD-binding oxidoreductase [Pseudorhodobacter aquimaris]